MPPGGNGGRWLAVTDASDDFDLRDGRTGKKIRGIEEAPKQARLAANPVRDELAVLDSDGSLVLCDPVAGKRLWRVRGHRPDLWHDNGAVAFDRAARRC